MIKEQLLRELEKIALFVASHSRVPTSSAYEQAREVWVLWWKVKNDKD